MTIEEMKADSAARKAQAEAAAAEYWAKQKSKPAPTKAAMEAAVARMVRDLTK